MPVSLCHCTCSQDSGTRKAALLVQYVDLHNEFVLEKKGKHGAKYLEMFQVFRWATRHSTLIAVLSGLLDPPSLK